MAARKQPEDTVLRHIAIPTKSYQDIQALALQHNTKNNLVKRSEKVHTEKMILMLIDEGIKARS